MIGLGTLANVGTVVMGGVLGSFVIPKIPEHVSQATIQAVGIGVILMGLQMAWGTQHLLAVLISLALGTILGELMGIEAWLNRMAKKLERLPFARRGDFAKGFVQATLLFCVGAMAITGSLQDGLGQKPLILYTKSMLDGVSATMFSSVMGPGVILSALPILIYQGSMTLGAGFLSQILTDAMITEINAAGGLMVAAIGLNLVGATQIRVANMLPALVIVAVLVALGIPGL